MVVVPSDQSTVLIAGLEVKLDYSVSVTAATLIGSGQGDAVAISVVTGSPMRFMLCCSFVKWCFTLSYMQRQ